MQTSSARTPLRLPRFDSLTGKRRGLFHGWRVLAAGLAIALLAGSGIAVAAVASNASAHVPSVSASCTGVHVQAQWYNTGDGSKINTVVVEIDGVPQSDGNNTSPINFTNDYDHTFAFVNPAVSHHYLVKITAWDGTDTNGYNKTVEADSPVCAPPTLKITPTTCTVAGGTIDIVADVTDLDTTHGYTIALSSGEAGASNYPAAAFNPGAATGSKTFTPVTAGHNYTVTIVDTTTQLSASSDVFVVGCPQDSTIKVTATECTTDGGTGGLTVGLSNLSNGRVYTVTVLDNNGVVQSTKDVTSDASGVASIPFDVVAGGTYKATVIDKAVGASSLKTSDAKTYLPCPKKPGLPEVDPSQCTSTDGNSDATFTFNATGLVPLRHYRVTVTDGNNAIIFDSQDFVASTSNWPVLTPSQTIPVNPGTYTVTVQDVALGAFVNSASATILDCPTLPELAFTPTECTAPGGSGSILTTVTNFIAGRDYSVSVTLSQGGTVVVPAATITAPLNGPWVLAPFGNLPPGVQYRITVTDTVVPSVSAYGDVALKPCPGTPSISVKASCNVLGISTLNVSLDKLENGETYTVTVTNASNNKVVGTASTPGNNPAVSLQVKNVPNGNQYTVDVANASKTLTGSSSLFLKNCDLPTLAFTGANPIGPAVTGIGFLQFGLMFVGLGLVLKRRRTV